MKKYIVIGIDCPACATKIESDLSDIGINAKCSYATCELSVDTLDEKSVQKILEENGCRLKNESKK